MRRPGWFLVALLIPLQILMLIVSGACSNQGEDRERAWAQEVTGAVAMMNDVASLELVPALTDESGGIQVGDEADFVAIARACERLGRSAKPIEKAAVDPPEAYEEAARLATELHRSLADVGSRCQAAATASDLEALQALGDDLTALANLVERIGRELPDGVGCPERLRDDVQTCQLED